MSASARVEIAPEVRAVLSTEMTARLLAGHVGPTDYHCVICDRPGTLVRDRTSAVLFDPHRTPVLSWAHTSCSRSRILPISRMPARMRQRDRLDLVGTPVLLELDRTYAGLLLRPRDRVLSIDGRQVTDVVADRIRAAGLIPLPGPLCQPPPVLPGWRIAVGGDGNVGPVTRRGLRAKSRSWWTQQGLVATAAWVAATRDGAVILLVAAGAWFGGSVLVSAARPRTR